MGEPKEPQPARLFMGLIASEDDLFRQGLKDLCLAFGKVDFISEKFPFNFTEYYAKEMGEELFRHFITFEQFIEMIQLPDIKQATNRLEKKYSSPNGNRRINMDPGYLCLEHVILATTKGYTHRPYLREGIYADLTMVYRNKSFQTLEWTYPDYRQEKVIELFNEFRKKYLEDLKRRSQQRCSSQ